MRPDRRVQQPHGDPARHQPGAALLHGSKGASLSQAIKHERDRWLNGQGVVVVDLSRRCNVTFRSLMRGQGPPGAVDCLLAAESLARGWPLVTSNVNDFREVAGLRVVPVSPPK